MPSGKHPLRQRLFRQRGATVASISPDDLSPRNQVPPQESSLQQQQRQQKQHQLLYQTQAQQQKRDSPVLISLVSPAMANNQSSWNNTEPDEDNQEGGGARKDNACNAEQRDRLAKCQKSLEQLEFSLNNLLLSASLAANQRRNQRRLEDADRFFSDLVESIRNNRASRRRWPKACRATNWQQEKQSAEDSAAMRRKLQDESRALWRAQHIGAKCEDTVDRYMLDVVVDKLGEMADSAGMNDCGGGGGSDGARKNGGRRRRPPSCGRCGGVPKGGGSRGGGGGGGGSGGGEASSDGEANKHNSYSEPRDSACRVGQRQQQANNRSDDSAEASISFRKRMQLRGDAPRAKRSQQQQQQQLQNSDATAADKQQIQQQMQQEQQQQAASDHWTLRTWQPVTAASSANNNDALNSCNSNSNNNNCNSNNYTVSNNRNSNNSSNAGGDSNANNNQGCACRSRLNSELVTSVAAYQRGSRRYEKALRVAAYLRDLCREFYRTSCSGRAPPAAQALEATMEALRQLVSMRDRAVALAIRCTACPALCSAERLSSPQLCRLRTLMRLACTQDSCGVGQLDLAEALADADQSPSRCRLLRQLSLVATDTDGPDADYRRIINAMASLTELKNCSANYNAHRRRMCGTLGPLAPGIRGVTRGDMRALALDLAAAGAKVDGGGGRQCRRRSPRRLAAAGGGKRGCCRGGDMEPALVEALHNPKEMRRRLQMHKFATGATLAVKAEEEFQEP